jgi:hypothetical protein
LYDRDAQWECRAAVTPDEANAALKELLLAEISGLRALITEKDERFRTLVTEKDTLYTDRDASRQKAVDSALAAAKAGIDAAFASSEKASGKSEVNAEKWRENANEWRSAMVDREIKFASRIEVDNELKNLRTELASLKETRAEGTGERRHQGDTRALWLAGVATIGLLVTLITFVLRLPGDKPAPVATAPQVIYVPSPPGTLLPTTPPTQPAR